MTQTNPDSETMSTANPDNDNNLMKPVESCCDSGPRYNLKLRMWVCLAITGIFFTSELTHFFGTKVHKMLPLILATPVIFWGAQPFFRWGLEGVFKGKFNMFTLVSMGITIAFCYSLALHFLPLMTLLKLNLYDPAGSYYFAAVITITTLVLIGQVIEQRMQERSGSAIEALMSLAPKNTTLIGDKRKKIPVSIEKVVPGDILYIDTGEHFPVDGAVIEGEGSVNEAFVTGEAALVPKKVGDLVLAGSENSSRPLTIKTLRTKGETFLSQIIKMVEHAQSSELPIQRLVDRISQYFVPGVLTIALGTLGIWSLHGDPILGLLCAIAVMIIACPCALGLATPMSIMMGVGRGAQQGILIKHAKALEITHKANTLVVDKTGTLTWGEPKIIDAVALNNMSVKDSLKYVASLEASSQHPLARAIVNRAIEENIQLMTCDTITTHPGKGISGKIGKISVLAGNEKLMHDNGIDTSLEVELAMPLMESEETVLYVAINGKLELILSLADDIKNTARNIVNDLKNRNIDVVMLTGDQEAPARDVAKKLGIDKYGSNMLPDQKQAYVKKLQEQGQRVIMAGDGVNDAPAMAQADVAIAMATGTNVAIECADITLLRGDIRGIKRVIDLSSDTMNNIKQNLFFAFGYNSLCIPVAAGLLYPFSGLLISPVYASVAMVLSSISVILNSMRLRS